MSPPTILQAKRIMKTFWIAARFLYDVIGSPASNVVDELSLVILRSS